MENFIMQDQLENQEQDGRTRLEGNITDRRNARMEEKSRRLRSMDASSEESRGPEGAVVPSMENLAWMLGERI
jgi:hypothetical protein